MQDRTEVERYHALVVEANAQRQLAKLHAEIKRFQEAAGQPAHRRAGD